MPLTVGAIRKQRADKKRAAVNSRVRRAMKDAVAAMRKKPSAVNLKESFSRLDKAAKSGVVHKNKAARLKSRLSKSLKAK